MTWRSWAWPTLSGEVVRRASEIERRLGIPSVIARVLAGRGMGVRQAESLVARTLQFCTDDIGEPDYCDEAARALLNAARNGRIGILCDYDVDGSTAQSILVIALRAVMGAGWEDPVVVVPDRQVEGFGPNGRCLDELVNAGVTCVAVLDCGTASGPLLDQYHAEHGMLPVVIDHHPARHHDPPQSGVLVNPWQSRGPDPGEQGAICTAVLCWFLARRLLRLAGLTRGQTGIVRCHATVFAALGTVCDVMRMDKPFNRAIVKAGVRLMATDELVPASIRAISASAGLGNDATVADLGWRIGPRINAGSRMGNSALASRCLRSTNPAEARSLADELDLCNRERTKLSALAVRELMDSPDHLDLARGPVNVYVAQHARLGTVGLVAGDTTRQFGWPSVAFVLNGDGVFAGSGRSALGFDLGAAVSAAVRAGLALKGGGHAKACGVNVDPSRLDEFRQFMHARFAETMSINGETPVPTYKVDAELGGIELSPEGLETIAMQLEAFEPWGEGLRKPQFGIRGCCLRSFSTMNGGHLRMMLDKDGQRFRSFWFRPPEDWRARMGLPEGATSGYGDHAAVIGQIELDTWRDRREGRFVIRDAKPTADVGA